MISPDPESVETRVPDVQEVIESAPECYDYCAVWKDEPYSELNRSRLPELLTAWYARRPEVRRLWAVLEREELVVLLALEPTVDGNDSSPVWLARFPDWRDDLVRLARAEVRLSLVDGTYPLRRRPGSILLIQLDWRAPDGCLRSGSIA